MIVPPANWRAFDRSATSQPSLRQVAVQIAAELRTLMLQLEWVRSLAAVDMQKQATSPFLHDGGESRNEGHERTERLTLELVRPPSRQPVLAQAREFWHPHFGG
jgi:hypothetical protein